MNQFNKVNRNITNLHLKQKVFEKWTKGQRCKTVLPFCVVDDITELKNNARIEKH